MAVYGRPAEIKRICNPVTGKQICFLLHNSLKQKWIYGLKPDKKTNNHSYI
jgi:hypothetical protein